MKNNCVICDAEFEARTIGKYCSEECKRLAKIKRNRKPIRKKNCGVCDILFEPKTIGLYCSKKCKKIINRKHYLKNKDKYNARKRVKNPLGKVTRNCLTCGVTFKRHFNAKYCQASCQPKEYYQRFSRPRYNRTCVICLNDFITGWKNGVTCSKECKRTYKNKAHERRYIKKGPHNINCGICNTPCIVLRYTTTVCSDVCRKEDRRRKHNLWLKTNRKPLTPKYKLHSSISKGVRRSLKFGNKEGPVFSLLEYTRREVFIHIESLFTDGMSWDNIGEWHIDHIRPIASFDFDSTDHPDFKKCWALNNLQPLWAADNMSKRNKWDGVVNA
jgi:hypothetical protein